MRVLVVATQPQFSLGARLMASLAAGLAARGDVVALATAARSDTEKAVERTWPRLSVRSVSGAGWFRQAVSLRGIVTALRPDALLVGSEHDAVLGAFAMGRGGAIVRRFTTEERVDRTTRRDQRHEALPWRARFALSRARVVAWGEEALAVGWPTADDAQREVYRLPTAGSGAPIIALMPGAAHDSATATALRTIAHLHARHPELELLLLGDASALQATRIHAAALGLSERTSVRPVDALLHHELRHVTSLWVAAAGDVGAIATLAAMQQEILPVVAEDAAFASLIMPGVSGLIAPADGAGLVASELARVMGDAAMREQMGRAAMHKAMRDHEWNAFVDTAAALLAQAAGINSTRVTRRPSITPA